MTNANYRRKNQFNVPQGENKMSAEAWQKVAGVGSYKITSSTTDIKEAEQYGSELKL